MFQIEARDKYKNLLKTRGGKIRILVSFLVSFLVSGLIYLLYHNLLATLTTAFALTGFLAVNIIPPKRIKIVIDDSGFINIDGRKIKLEECDSWALVDLFDTVEIAIRRSGAGKDIFYYFYIEEQNRELSGLVNQLTQKLPYNSETGKDDFAHDILRLIGLQ